MELYYYAANVTVIYRSILTILSISSQGGRARTITNIAINSRKTPNYSYALGDAVDHLLATLVLEIMFGVEGLHGVEHAW